MKFVIKRADSLSKPTLNAKKEKLLYREWITKSMDDLPAAERKKWKRQGQYHKDVIINGQVCSERYTQETVYTIDIKNINELITLAGVYKTSLLISESEYFDNKGTQLLEIKLIN